MITQEDTKDLQKSGKYFAINQSNASKIEFNFEAPVQKEINEHKGVKGIIYMSISAVLYTLIYYFTNTQATLYINIYILNIYIYAYKYIHYKIYLYNNILIFRYSYYILKSS